jgi:hypothetical protein
MSDEPLNCAPGPMALDAVTGGNQERIAPRRFILRASLIVADWRPGQRMELVYIRLGRGPQTRGKRRPAGQTVGWTSNWSRGFDIPVEAGGQLGNY